jgi:hypothetical protein
MSGVPYFNFAEGGSVYIEGDVRVLGIQNDQLIIQAVLKGANISNLNRIAIATSRTEFKTHNKLKEIAASRLETRPVLIDQLQLIQHQIREPAYAIIRLLQKVS